MWWKKKISEVSTSEDDLDSGSAGEDSEDEEEEEEEQNGPTLVTVDDGKGGVKHIKVSDPCRGEYVKQHDDGVLVNHMGSR